MSDFNLFGLLKESLRGQHFSSDKELKMFWKWLKMQPVKFTMKEYVHLLKGGKRWFGKWEIISRSNYEMLMLYTFL